MPAQSVIDSIFHLKPTNVLTVEETHARLRAIDPPVEVTWNWDYAGQIHRSSSARLDILPSPGFGSSIRSVTWTSREGKIHLILTSKEGVDESIFHLNVQKFLHLKLANGVVRILDREGRRDFRLLSWGLDGGIQGR